MRSRIKSFLYIEHEDSRLEKIFLVIYFAEIYIYNIQ